MYGYRWCFNLITLGNKGLCILAIPDPDVDLSGDNELLRTPLSSMCEQTLDQPGHGHASPVVCYGPGLDGAAGWGSKRRLGWDTPNAVSG
jgi:hypothetical protein